MNATHTIEGEPLILLAQRAIYWPTGETLFVADTHFGKPESFRALRVPVPGGVLGVALARLTDALVQTSAKRLVILGDFWHTRDSRTDAVEAELLAWRDRHFALEIEVILGNHDRGTGGPPQGWANRVTVDCHRVGPFVATHYPTPHPDGYVLAGHLHPAAVLHGRGRQRLRLAAFWFGPTVGVLPAFGEFTGVAEITPAPGDAVYVIADAHVVAVPV
jgi:DNA ligase-associated metallophosphoesterase